MQSFNQKIVFNSSMPRSGSTLMQNILAQNPRFYCSPTSGVMNILLAARMQYTNASQFKAQDPALMRKGFNSLCKYALHGFYEGITDKPVCVDKSRTWFHYFDWIKMFHPEVKIIVCVRDLRAILSSMEKLFRKNRDIADAQDHPDRMNMVTVRNRLLHWLNGNPVGLTCTALMEAIESGHMRHFHVVPFEELSSNPKATMRKVYDYLGEPQFEHDFEHVEQKTVEDDTEYPIYGDHKIRQQVRPVPPDWNEVLGRELSQMVKDNNPLYYSTFYPDKR